MELYLHSLICLQGVHRDTFAFVVTVMSYFHDNAEDISYNIECLYKLFSVEETFSTNKTTVIICEVMHYWLLSL
jgi:hypothetical protein